MCGIAGIINGELGRDELQRVLTRMQEGMRHRGPDDQGIYMSPGERAGLVSTRLAILDLSQAGHQPMRSGDGRFHIVFNGEIYNFEELRSELINEGEQFESHSDTEVVLKMYQRYGPDAVREFEGMFAFAIWDEREQSCFLARGPLGIKPVYYHARHGRLIFASELRPLIGTGLIDCRLSREATAGYLLFGAVPEPLTLIDEVSALPPGHYLHWKKGRVTVERYWEVRFGNDPIDPAEAVATLRAALLESVDRHFVSDVPVGMFLSGGLDSTALVALAATLGKKNVRTFCISFDDPRYSEGEIAARTARHFGAEHCDWRLDSKTAKGLLPKFLESSDQPSIDGFNTFCVSRFAHDHGLKVVLSGVGGDELFGGYQSFNVIPRLLRMSRGLNPVWPLRTATGKLLRAAATTARVSRLGHFFQEPPTMSAAYWCMRGTFTPGEIQLLLRRYCFADDNEADSVNLQYYVPPQPTIEDEVSYLEVTRYMRNQLLRDSDVMSMAWSLELRVPFVDSKLATAISRIPAACRLQSGKNFLLQAVPEIPEWVLDQPKRGFVFPFKEWVTGQWEDVFRDIDASSPVPLRNWYRRWCLFALESFLSRNGLASQADLLSKDGMLSHRNGG